MIKGTKEEITEVIKNALQLQPDEKAIVIIDHNNKRTIDTVNVSTGTVLVTLAMALAEIMYLCSISRNISEEERLSYLELLLSFIKGEYEAHYSKGTNLNPNWNFKNYIISNEFMSLLEKINTELESSDSFNHPYCLEKVSKILEIIKNKLEDLKKGK